MQFVNDDMDDLFRRAAEEYPLKTDSGDWNKMMNKMHADRNDSNGSGKNDNKKRYLFLLALIPLLLICTTYIQNNHSATSRGKISKRSDTEQIVPKNKMEPVKPRVLEDNLDNSPNSINVASSTTINATGQIKTGRVAKFSVAGNTNTGRNNYDNAKEQTHDNSFLSIKQNALPLSSEVGNNGHIETIADANKTGKKNTTGNIQKSGDGQSVTGQQTATGENKRPINEKPEDVRSVPDAKEKKAKKQDTKLYLSFLAGPDFSMVKSTKISGIGYSIGLLAGYNFSKKLAVEMGVLWDRKKYKAEGRDFKTEKLNWPHVTIYDLQGYCDMYEIPLNFRYNFSANTKRTFFAIAGVSSYLMKTENYDYHYTRYGVQGYGNKEYKNTSKDWLSVAHISVGVQKKLGAIGDLRIEPYIKLPVNGVGIGSMPLRSTGVYLGITRPIR
jgi:hypothetical protein